MSNILQELAARYGLTVKGTQAWGTVEGYWFQIALPEYGSNVMQMRTALLYADEAAQSGVADALHSMARENPSVACNISGGTVVLGLKKGFGGFKAEEAEGVLLKAVSAFRPNGAEPACFNCAENRAEDFAMVNGVALKLCSQCLGDIENTIAQQTTEHAALKSNYVLGIVGAILGALVGSIVWVLFGMLGRVAVLGGMAISFCAIKGYALFKGKVTIAAIVVICLISIVFMFVAQFFIYDIAVYNDLSKEYSDVNIGTVTQLVFNGIMTDSEVRAESLQNCPLGLLFLAVGMFIVLRPYFAKAKAPAGKFEKL